MLARPNSMSRLMDDVTRASWRRCAETYGLERGQRPMFVQVDNVALQDSLDAMGDGLAEAAAIIENARRVARDTGFHILLSDPTATVVKSFADTSGGADLVAKGLVPGSIWQERLVGTNGLGTCASIRDAVTITGPSHFCEALAAYTCSAAPILAPDGELWGVFNLTSLVEAHRVQSHFAHEFSLTIADQISGVLFRLRHRENCVIALSDNPAVPLSLSSLVAIDRSGVVVGVTTSGLELLGAKTFSDALGRPLKALLAFDGRDGEALLTATKKATAQEREIYVTPFAVSRSHRTEGRTSAVAVPRTRACEDSRPLDRLAGSDPRLSRQVAVCRRLLDHDLPLLLLGETGVGKDTFARAFHAESQRGDKPYVAVNCAAIPEGLLASELFGYAPGTFTGGLKRGKEGKIAASNGGTLFLDEIGDMPLELQAHLLRVLEDRLVSPLGSTDSISVDIRIICATHCNLAELIAKNAFRKDLYFRIKGAQINLPPLRERDDLVELLNRIIADEVGPDAAARITVTQPVIDIFQQYRWPGNVRELKSIVRYILTVCSEDIVTIDDLPEELRDPDARHLPVSDAPFHDAETSQSSSGLGQLQMEQKQRIVGTLRKNKWNITKTAEQLEISRATLHRKILRLKIVSPNTRG